MKKIITSMLFAALLVHPALAQTGADETNATANSPYSAFSRGIEDRKTGEIIKLAALRETNEGENTKYQFVQFNGDAPEPIGPVMEEFPWLEFQDEINKKYGGKIPVPDRRYTPRIIMIPAFGLALVYSSITGAPFGHAGSPSPLDRVIFFPAGLVVFAAGIPVGAAIDVVTLSIRGPRNLIYAIRNGNLVKAFQNVMSFHKNEGKPPKKVGHRAFTHLKDVIIGHPDGEI